jgi:hypothetical protein
VVHGAGASGDHAMDVVMLAYVAMGFWVLAMALVMMK